jgi:hypothetical protein
MLWEGRLGWKQFIRTKQARFYAKTPDLCERSFGYVFSNTVYTGKGIESMEDIELWLSDSLEMQLIDLLLDVGRIVYLDIWYSSSRLNIEHHDKGTDVCRRVQKNTYVLQKDIDKKALKRGELEVWQLPPLSCVVEGQMLFICSLQLPCQGDLIDTGKQDSKTKLQIFKPDIVHKYNQYMWWGKWLFDLPGYTSVAIDMQHC